MKTGHGFIGSMPTRDIVWGHNAAFNYLTLNMFVTLCSEKRLYINKHLYNLCLVVVTECAHIRQRTCIFK